MPARARVIGPTGGPGARGGPPEFKLVGGSEDTGDNVGTEADVAGDGAGAAGGVAGAVEALGSRQATKPGRARRGRGLHGATGASHGRKRGHHLFLCSKRETVLIKVIVS